MGKTKKKHCWVTIILTSLSSAFFIFLAIQSASMEFSRTGAKDMTITTLCVGACCSFILWCISYFIESSIVFKEERKVAARAEAIHKRQEAIKQAEEEKRQAEEARKTAEANTELWTKRWESHIKPFLKFVFGACVLFAIVCIIIGGASAFISSFGMVAFLLLLILLF